MNISTVYRMYEESESTGRHRFGGKKPINGDKRRRCEDYNLKRSNYVRRKQQKVRYDTWRRQEMNNEEDEKLENIHYANFLGDKYDKYDKYETPYNSSDVSLDFCDCMLNVTVDEEFYDPCWLVYKASMERYHEYMPNGGMTNEEAHRYRDIHFPEFADFNI